MIQFRMVPAIQRQSQLIRSNKISQFLVAINFGVKMYLLLPFHASVVASNN